MIAVVLLLAGLSLRHASVAAAQSSNTAATTLVGVVLPSDAAPGDTISGTVVADPEQYEHVPGLRVVRAEVPAADDSADQASNSSLDGVVVDLGDGRKQAADRPLVVKLLPGATSMAISVLGRDGQPLGRQTLPLAPAASSPAAPAPQLADCTMPSVTVPGATQVIHGPTSGDANSLHLAVDDQPAQLLAVSPRSLFWKVPGDLPEGGPHTVTLSDAGQQVKLPLYVLGLQMKADNTHLVKGQSTGIHVIVTGLENLPAEAWEAGAPPADLVDLKALEAEQEGFRLPGPKEPGEVLLLIENHSPEVVRMGKKNVILMRLHQENFASGPYVHNDVLKSLHSGNFHISSTVVACLKTSAHPKQDKAGHAAATHGPPAHPEAPPPDKNVRVEGLVDGSIIVEKTNPDGTRVSLWFRPDGTLDPYLSYTESSSGSRTTRKYLSGRITISGGGVFIYLTPTSDGGYIYRAEAGDEDDPYWSESGKVPPDSPTGIDGVTDGIFKDAEQARPATQEKAQKPASGGTQEKPANGGTPEKPVWTDPWGGPKGDTPNIDTGHYDDGHSFPWKRPPSSGPHLEDQQLPWKLPPNQPATPPATPPATTNTDYQVPAQATTSATQPAGGAPPGGKSGDSQPAGGPKPAPVTPQQAEEQKRKLIDNLHQSADFWRGEAAKSKQFAQEAKDPKSKQQFEDRAKWEEANAKWRDDMAGQMQGATAKPEEKGKPQVQLQDPKHPTFALTKKNPDGTVTVVQITEGVLDPTGSYTETTKGTVTTRIYQDGSIEVDHHKPDGSLDPSRSYEETYEVWGGRPYVRRVYGDGRIVFQPWKGGPEKPARPAP